MRTPPRRLYCYARRSITNELDGTEDDILWQDDRNAPCADSDNEGEEMYDDMLTTDQMIQMLEEGDSDKFFLGFD